MEDDSLINQRFGELVVVSFYGRDCYSHKIWQCKCSCGNNVQALEHNLKNKLKKSTRSCGCLRRRIQQNQDPIGKKFGKMSVIKFSHSRNKKSYYQCVCDCGNTKNATMNSLQSGDCLSCGCSQYSHERTEKIKNTCLEKYGFDNPTKNKEIRLKAAKSCNNSFLMYHWNSGAQLICQGGYEQKVVEWLNLQKKDFNWQPKSFIMQDGRTYSPDLYLVDENKWIEIKGYFYGDAEEKWNWFHENNENSELWNKQKLKEMKIL